jgi:hypothetical protein
MLAVFGWEVLCALVVLYSVAQLVRGKRINQLLTDHYRPVIEKALTEMFTICRHHSETTGQVISYATGREHLASLSVRLSLRPRYDFVRSVWDWVSKYRSPGAANVGDQLDYEVIPDDKYQRNSAGFIFAICRQSAIAQLKTERYDLATFARVFNKNNQSVARGNLPVCG